MALIKTKPNQSGEDGKQTGEEGALVPAGQSASECSHHGNQYGASSENKTQLPAVALLGTYTREPRTTRDRDACSAVLAAALLK